MIVTETNDSRANAPESPRSAVDGAWDDWVRRARELLAQRQVHPARAVVLLPYAQLMGVAAQAWARAWPDGFAPRFETTRNWADQWPTPPAAPTDVHHDVAHDSWVALGLLQNGALKSAADRLHPLLMAAIPTFSALAAAQPPAVRDDWALALAALPMFNPAATAFRDEAAAHAVALQWAAQSGYATDVLFDPAVRRSVDLLIVCPGHQRDALTDALVQHWGDAAVVLPWGGDAPPATLHVHAACHMADEAERAAAEVLHLVRQGHVPVALVANDRSVTRRVQALLHGACNGADSADSALTLRDETGWALSTTHAAAQLMAVLEALGERPGTDAVLNALKALTAADRAQAAAVADVEALLRKNGVAHWPTLWPEGWALPPRAHDLVQRWQATRNDWRAPRTLRAWRDTLRTTAQAWGPWDAWLGDPAGLAMLRALNLLDAGEADVDRLPSTLRPLPFGVWLRWVREALEGARFVPPKTPDAHVITVPLAQLFARNWGSVVIAGCDELHLPLAPEPPGSFSAAERLALGLPSREELQATQARVWAHLAWSPQVHAFWRQHDEAGEAMSPSPLLLAQGGTIAGADARALRLLAAASPAHMPAPSASDLAPTRLSASAYGDLRACPYRFFAMRMLRLLDAPELEEGVDKRDFGNWLHTVLKAFHESPREADVAAQLDAIAQAQAREMGLSEADFLPFQANWPPVRDAYLVWLAQHEASGAVFEHAEWEREQGLGELTLIGTIDRVDRAPGEGSNGHATPLLIDYKTESLQTTERRLKDPLEDTQIAFYAALVDEDPVRAAYLNISERGEVVLKENHDISAVRDALVEGVMSDMARIGDGAALPALGEGLACAYCAARGVCRKDDWS